MRTFNLKQFRSSNGLTLKEVAKKTGIPSIHLSEIERGLRPMSSLHQEKIMIAFPDSGSTDLRNRNYRSVSNENLVKEQ
jgi:transcriptional regulator with XRE-family HTH domain